MRSAQYGKRLYRHLTLTGLHLSLSSPHSNSRAIERSHSGDREVTLGRSRGHQSRDRRQPPWLGRHRQTALQSGLPLNHNARPPGRPLHRAARPPGRPLHRAARPPSRPLHRAARPPGRPLHRAGSSMGASGRRTFISGGGRYFRMGGQRKHRLPSQRGAPAKFGGASINIQNFAAYINDYLHGNSHFVCPSAETRGAPRRNLGGQSRCSLCPPSSAAPDAHRNAAVNAMRI